MLLLALALSCVARQEARLEVRHEVVSQAMSGHLGQAGQARDAVVAGDLAASRAALADLRASLPLVALPPQGLRLDAVLVGAVDDALAAPGLPEVAAAVGQIAQTCGACHTTLGISLPVELAPPVGEDDSVLDRMRQHRDATGQMWSALVAGQDQAFSAGAALLRASTLAPSGTPVDAPVPPLAAELEIRVHDLAALAVRTPDQRGRYTGEMLGTCAQCHALLGRGPRLP